MKLNEIEKLKQTDKFYEWLDAKRARYAKWRSQVDEWSRKHGITTKSAMSILFNDSPYNPNGNGDIVIAKDLYWVEHGEFSDYYFSLKSNAKGDSQSPDQ